MAVLEMARREADEQLGLHPELAKIARQYAAGRSLRALEQKTGLGKSTLGRVLWGDSVSDRTLRDYARGLRKPLNPLLIAMGLEPISPDPFETPETTDREIRVPDEDQDTWEAYTRIVNPAVKASVNAMIRAAAEEDYRLRRDIIGKRTNDEADE